MEYFVHFSKLFMTLLVISIPVGTSSFNHTAESTEQPEQDESYNSSPDTELTSLIGSKLISSTESEVQPESELMAEEESESYYAEPEYDDESVRLKWIILFSIIIVIIIFGNICIITIILQDKVNRKKQANIFFLSLLFARTSVALLVIPARITGLFSFKLLGSVLCKLCHYAGRGSAVTSVLSTVAIALSKYREIRKTKQVPVKTSVFLLVLIWGIGYTWAIPSGIMNDLIYINTTTGSQWLCNISPDYAYINSIFIFVDFCLLFCIPFVIVITSYVGVLSAINKKNKTHEKLEDNEAKKAIVNGIRMVIVILILFTVCYSLPYIFKLYIFFKEINLFVSNIVEIEQWIYWASYANPWLNLIAYVLFREDIKSGLKNILCKSTNKIDPEEKIQSKKFELNK